MNILDVLSGTEERNDNNSKCICGEELCKKCRRNNPPIVCPYNHRPCEYNNDIICMLVSKYQEGYNNALAAIDNIKQEIVQSIENGVIQIFKGNEELFSIIDKHLKGDK